MDAAVDSPAWAAGRLRRSEMQMPPETRYVKLDAGYVGYQTFGHGPPACLFVTNWLQNLDVMWAEPTIARYFRRLSSFSQVVCFDKRGSGISDPVPLDSIPSLETWMDDAVRALDASGVGRAAVIGDTEGGPMAMMLAATFPERVTHLVLVNTFARWRRADDYPIGMPDGTWHKLVDRYEQHWGQTSEILSLTAPSMSNDGRFRDWFLRYQRLSMPPAAATAMYRWVTTLDVRPLLPLIRVPTLVIHRKTSPHYRLPFGQYLADHIPGATLVEIPGGDGFPFNAGDVTPILDEIERFLTGSRSEPVLDRMLATILFTDIVDSTRIAADRGDAAWLELLRRHDEIVSEHLDRYRGRQVNYTGDGVVAVFDGPARAVVCAARLREALVQIGITVRIGLHTGEFELKDDQIAGLAVHLAARIMAAAGPGRIFTSGTVRDLVLGSGIEFGAAGEHELKGVPGRWPLFELLSIP